MHTINVMKTAQLNLSSNIMYRKKILRNIIAVSSAVEFPALGFNINGGHMPYDLSATVHYKLTKVGNGHYNGHYTAISRSRDLQSQEWFMYDDDKVSSSNFTNKNTMVKKSYMKTDTILFYVSPSIETRIKNSKTIDLMEGGKEIDGDGKEGSVKDRVDIYVDGEEGKADGSSDENDKKNDEEEEEGERGKVDSSSGKESLGSSDLSSTTEIHQKRGTRPRGLRIIDSLSKTDFSFSSSSTTDSSSDSSSTTDSSDSS